MENKENLTLSTLIFSPIPLAELAEAIWQLSSRANIAPKSESPNDDMLSISDVCVRLGRTRPSIRKYIKEGKLRVHYLDNRSPIFLRSEFNEDALKLPGYTDKNK